MTLVYLLRHPETTWNLEQRYQGRLDSEPSRKGWRQVKLVARAFDGLSLDAVYSSPLYRSRALALELAHATDSPLVIDHRLTEIGQCPWEGLYLSEIQSLYPGLMKRWYERPDTVRFPAGESIHDVQRRTLSVLKELFDRAPTAVAIVTHNSVIHAVVAPVLGLDLQYIHRIPVTNCGLTILFGDVSPGRLLTLNSTDILYGSPITATLARACVS